MQQVLHLIGQRPDSTGSGMYLQAIMQCCTENSIENILLGGIQSGNKPQLSSHSIKHKDFVQFGGKDLSFEIVGMSDVMPYNSRTFSSLSSAEFDMYIQEFTQKLANIISQHSPDIIHAHHLLLTTSLAKQFFPHIPVTATCHGTDLRQFKNCLQLQDFILKGCRELDHIMALSNLQKKEICDIYGISPERVSTVGGGYQEHLFTRKEKEMSATTHILYAGKLSSFKGVPYLLNSLIHIKNYDFHLHLVGSSSGSQLKNCQELAKKLGDKVTVYGAIPQQKLASLMSKSHLFIYPSFFEGLPLVLLEALASGCAIITTKLPGSTEIIEKTGTKRMDVIPLPPMKSIDIPKDEYVSDFEQNLSDRIIHFMEKRKTSGFQNTLPPLGDIEYFTWPRVFQRVQNVYEKITR